MIIKEDSFELEKDSTSKNPEEIFNRSPDPIFSPVFSQAKTNQTISYQEQPLETMHDLPLKVTVELGRAKMTLGQLLQLEVGSIIPLNKSSGESLDLLINGKHIAQVEAIVIDEELGIRITEIADPKKEETSSRKSS